MTKLEYNDLLICDPCYIKSVMACGENRFDALKHIKTLHEGDDGEYEFMLCDQRFSLGVDSGRVWVMKAEFDCEVDVDSGFSGHKVIKGGATKLPLRHFADVEDEYLEMRDNLESDCDHATTVGEALETGVNYVEINEDGERHHVGYMDTNGNHIILDEIYGEGDEIAFYGLERDEDGYTIAVYDYADKREPSAWDEARADLERETINKIKADMGE